MLYYIRLVGPGVDKLFTCKNYLSALKLFNNFESDLIVVNELYYLYLIRVENDSCFKFFSEEEIIEFIYSKYLINCKYEILNHRAIFIPGKVF